MAKSDGPTIVQIDMKDVKLSKIDWADLEYVPGEPFGVYSQDTRQHKPIVIEGFYDDSAIPFLDVEPTRELTIVNGRRFLWWTVAKQRIRQTVTLQPHTIAQLEDGVNISVPMKCEGPAVVIRSPWWERTLYAIARIWSW